jgi:hypothetical protein
MMTAIKKSKVIWRGESAAVSPLQFRKEHKINSPSLPGGIAKCRSLRRKFSITKKFLLARSKFHFFKYARNPLGYWLELVFCPSKALFLKIVSILP